VIVGQRMQHALPPASLAQLAGVWRRDLYETPLTRDTESVVFWVQGRRLYGDLRDQGNGMTAFSGHLENEADVFTWNMALASFPLPELPDAGRLCWDGSDLVEVGVHQAYREIWRPVGRLEDDDFALRLDNSAGLRATVLHIAGFRFAMIGRSGQLAISAALRGHCPRFGSVERTIGPCASLTQLLEHATPGDVPPGWQVRLSELHLERGGAPADGAVS